MDVQACGMTINNHFKQRGGFMTAIDDRPGLLERMRLEQIPGCDRPSQRPVFGLPASCPRCADPLMLINSKAEETLSIGIMACAGCRREFELTVRLSPHVGRPS